MRSCLFFLFFLPLFAFSQGYVEGSVVDRYTGAGLAFCSVGVKGSSYGCITNEDGKFKLWLTPGKDTLVVAYMGYTTVFHAVQVNEESITVALGAKDLRLTEVVISEENNFPYQLLAQTRKELQNRNLIKSKVYFQLSSERRGVPTEMLECYYNGSVKGASIRELQFKNGRVGLSRPDSIEGYFINVNSSRAFCLMNLSSPSDLFPAIPLQWDAKNCKKRFIVEVKSFDDEEGIYCIAFKPREERTGFTGELWITKTGSRLVKVKMEIEDAITHPFLPMRNIGSLDKVYLKIEQNFQKLQDSYVLSVVDFGYGFTFHSGKYDHDIIDTVQQVAVDGMMNFFDHGAQFILPYYEYYPTLTDYLKIDGQPENPKFWENNPGLLYTAKQEQALSFFKRNGTFLGSSNKGIEGSGFDRFVWNNVVWSPERRVILQEDLSDYKEPGPPVKGMPVSRIYDLKVQLFLDLNPVGDSIVHCSATIFDVYSTIFQIKADSMSNCIANIYFDLCEIERRKMDLRLSEKNWSKIEIDQIYRETQKAMQAICKQFMSEVAMGKFMHALRKWNKVVSEELGIDNMRLFNVGTNGS